jgi:hypothetical protein
MFQTNSIIWNPLILVHMVSGGPVYVADEIEETNEETINKLCFSDGKLPRLDMPAMPTVDALFGDAKKDSPCKMWNYHDLDGWGRIYYYYLANMIESDEPLTAKISLQDCGATAGLEKCNHGVGEYLLVELTSLDYLSYYMLSKEQASDAMTVENMEARYFIISPIVDGIAIIGKEGMYNGTKAITNARITKDAWSGTTSIHLDVAHAGTFLLYSKKEEAMLKYKLEKGARVLNLA